MQLVEHINITFNQQKNVFNDNIYYFSRKLDVDAMNKASSYLLGVQDFTSFSKLHTQTHTNFVILPMLIGNIIMSY